METTVLGDPSTPDVLLPFTVTGDGTSSVTINISSPTVPTLVQVTSSSEEAGNLQTSINTTDIASSVNGTTTIGSSLNYTTTILNYTSDAISTSSILVTSLRDDTEEEEVVVLAQQIASGIDLWLPPFLCFAGVAANILVILVMQSRHFRRVSTSFYMAVTAMVDCLSLMVPLPAHYLYVNFPQIFDNARDDHGMCSVFHFFGWFSSNMGVFLTVAMTVDRSLAIQFPLRAPTLCTVRRAKIVTLCLILFEVLKEGHLVFTTRVAPKEVTAYLCEVDTDFDKAYEVFHDYYWPYITNISLLLSFIVIIIGNIIITVHVKRSEDNKDMGEGAKSSGGSQPGKTSSKSRQLSLMLIIDSVSVMICTLPFAIYILLDQSFQLFEDSPQGRGMQHLVFSTTFYLLYVNRCANFFLYCLSGSRFRQILKEILTRKSAAQKTDSRLGILTSRSAGSSTFSVREQRGGNNSNVCASSVAVVS